MTAPLLAVDIGNTAIKAGLFRAADLGDSFCYAASADHNQATAGEPAHPAWLVELETKSSDLSSLTARLSEPVRWLVSSVNRPAEQQLAAWVRQTRSEDTYRQLTFRDVPLKINVDFPERVGFDRLATAVAAHRLRSQPGPVIVVDIGTALKVHAVSSDGIFLGGTIAPGLRLSARALAGETDLLPLVPVTTNAAPPPVIGKNTEAAIRSGLYWGVVGGVRETVTRMSRDFATPPEIFVTGGDARGLAMELGAAARYIADLCLLGIAFISQER